MALLPFTLRLLGGELGAEAGEGMGTPPITPQASPQVCQQFPTEVKPELVLPRTYPSARSTSSESQSAPGTADRGGAGPRMEWMGLRWQLGVRAQGCSRKHHGFPSPLLILIRPPSPSPSRTLPPPHFQDQPWFIHPIPSLPSSLFPFPWQPNQTHQGEGPGSSAGRD